MYANMALLSQQLAFVEGYNSFGGILAAVDIHVCSEKGILTIKLGITRRITIFKVLDFQTLQSFLMISQQHPDQDSKIDLV